MIRKLYIFITVIIIVCANAFSQEVFYEVTNSTIPVLLPSSERRYEPGELLFPAYFRAGVSNEGRFQVGCSAPTFTHSSAGVSVADIRINGTESFSADFLSDENNISPKSEYWIPTYNLFVLKEEDSEILFNYKKFIEHDKIYFENSEIFYFDNLIIAFDYSGNFGFIPTNIRKGIDDVYRVQVVPAISIRHMTWFNEIPTALFDSVKSNEPTTLYFYHNNNRLRVYIEGQQTPIWDLMKVNKKFNDLLEDFIEYKEWRGEKPYTEYLAPDILEDWPELTLDDIKANFYIETPETPTHTLDQNVPVYTVPHKYDDLQITSIPPNTPVYILESGSHAILDDIVAPWVQVELENGTRGWCWAGFLKDWSAEAAEERMEQEFMQEIADEEAILQAEELARLEQEAEMNKKRIILIAGIGGGVLLLVGVGLFFIKKK